MRAWIDSGAAWPADAERPTKSDHWSLQALVKPPVPVVPGKSVSNPIDAFIASQLADEHLQPSPEADRRTLVRRVFFDLIGLPPTPEAVAEFVADTSCDAYEKVVDRLLASPRYGERWARHWMDVIHFAETHGNDQDRPREHAWPYRDYLIRSFNEDKPYARFVTEQVAGDVLYPDDPQAIVALGFLAAGPWDESSMMCIVDDTVDKKLAQVLDRDDMIANVMSTFTSTTVHCARCHNHKFDPISQAEYYNLQAVFAGVDRADRFFDPDRAVHRRRRQWQRQRQALPSLAAEQLLSDAALQSQLAASEEHFTRRAAWQVVVPVAVSAHGASVTSEEDGSVIFGGTRGDRDTYTLDFETDLPVITAVRLEVLSDTRLPYHGPGRQDNGNLHLSEFKLTAAPAAGGEPAEVPIGSAYADFNQDGWTIAAAIDGKPDTAWGIHPQVGQSHSAIFVPRQPLATQARTRLTVVLEQLHGRGRLIGRPRLSVTSLPNPALAQAVAAGAGSHREQTATDPFRSGTSPIVALAVRACVWSNSQAHSPSRRPSMPPHTIFRATITFARRAGRGRCTCCDAATSTNGSRNPHRRSFEQSRAWSGEFQPSSADDEGSRRIAMARWLVDPGNVCAWRPDCEPHLALSFRSRHRRHAQRPGSHGGQALASGYVGLVGGRVSRRRGLAQAFTSADRNRRHLPAKQSRRSRAGQRRCRESPALADGRRGGSTPKASATPCCKPAASSNWQWAGRRCGSSSSRRAFTSRRTSTTKPTTSIRLATSVARFIAFCSARCPTR